MEKPADRRGARGVLTAALCGLCVLAFASSPPNAVAADEPTAPAMRANVLALAPGVVAMAPIPDAVSVTTGPDGATRATAVDRPQGEKNCLATAIYFEARGESTKGQKAVAEVVLTRARTPGRPKTICGVVYEGAGRATGCQFSFACDGVSDRVRDAAAWLHAERVATTVMRTRDRTNPVARGATYYHASYVTPSWATHMIKVAQIGSHIFYRP